MASLIDTDLFTELVEKQTRRYQPLFEKYPGHWALRRDLVWVPETAEYVHGEEEQPYILDMDFSKHYNFKAAVKLGLECLQAELGNIVFALRARRWLKENS